MAVIARLIMQEKDLAEKQLEVYEDVYADIVNVLLFQGEKRLVEEATEAASTQSTYISNRNLRGQDRDVAKYWKQNAIRLAFIGIENQTEIDRSMPLRIMGYDGAAYRAQLLDKKYKVFYPVITLVLYFGYERRWKRPLSLKEALKIPKELQPYINDYHLNMFEIAYLSEEQVAMFQSDFRIIADYFVQMRKTRDYVPNCIRMAHPYETLRLLSILTKDERFEKVSRQKQNGGVCNMCEVLDRVEAKGFKEGEKRGEKRGKKIGRLNTLKELVEAGLLSVEEASKRANMSVESFSKKGC